MDRRLERAAAGAALALLGWKVLQKKRQASLQGKVAFITGGSRGLGLLVARELARHGVRIAICARDATELEAARADLEARGAAVLTVRCDVRDRQSVMDAVGTARDHFGTIDVLVNNAGIIQVGPAASMRHADLENAMAINFWGAVHATDAVLPMMRQQGSGSIVNITSIGGYVAVPHMMPYTAAKFALAGYSEAMSAELDREGIRVTTVVPGLMRTGSPANALFRGRQEAEFTLFSLMSATPLTTMSAHRAARRIVSALRRGERSVTLTWQANLARAFHGLFPGSTAALMGAVNRILPTAPDEPRRQQPGMRLNTPLAPSPVTGLMNRAAIETHQYAGSRRPAPDHARAVGLDTERRRELH